MSMKVILMTLVIVQGAWVYLPFQAEYGSVDTINLCFDISPGYNISTEHAQSLRCGDKVNRVLTSTNSMRVGSNLWVYSLRNTVHLCYTSIESDDPCSKPYVVNRSLQNAFENKMFMFALVYSIIFILLICVCDRRDPFAAANRDRAGN